MHSPMVSDISLPPAPAPAPAQARTSCFRCHKRKKRCDRSLPSCKNCVSAQVRCGFEDDTHESASYPTAYVRGLEEKLRRLSDNRRAERQTASPTEETTNSSNNIRAHADFQTVLLGQGSSTPRAVNGCAVASTSASAAQTKHLTQGHEPDVQAASGQCSTFAQELTDLSLEATAERHLGSTSGLEFARLTQTMLRRLTPDKADFVFINQSWNATEDALDNFNSPSELFDNSFFQTLSESVSVHPLLFGDILPTDLTSTGIALDSLDWPSDQMYVQRLVDFYFAHSHTLYPVLNRADVVKTLDIIHQHPRSLALQAPLDIFRVWMVLAIGSTAYSSISLSEESESALYYSKALQYSELALGSDEMSALEVIMLQVSYSFFNQMGPNTWFLVGTAARLALGMGLHSSSTYNRMPIDVQQRRKRVFFSIYMMDRVVSIALGRPFALHDDDIDVTPFANVDEELIHADGISPQSPLEPSLMAIPLHILSLRRIAGKISRQIYGNVKNTDLTVRQREQIVSSLHQELLDWRRNMPFPLPDVSDRVPHLNSTWYDLNYYTHLAMIYRPSPLRPTPDLKQIKTLEMAASMSLRQAFSMHQQHRFAYNWLNFLSLFTSTLSLVYAITAQHDDLSAVQRDSRAVPDLHLAVQLFETLGLKFLAAKKIQTMIAEIARRYEDVRVPDNTGSFSGY